MRRSVCGVVLLGVLAVAGTGPAAQAVPGATSPRPASAPSAAGTWTCWWSPTMDDNWHNDALCSDGVRKVRPHLRPADSFITRAELMSSARAWARARNSGR
ncbi:hypothetical protein F4692_001730 [Nocardioides cavernae]|uniref:SLH domain-containing protein n=1 Tax=Nocardioides cavernae TaxID=1921566 RepID=A0A7Y9KSK6_9ACTN|nr:hypothetical protein [Nocardioides cavernae]NYE36597.1 hypothetical protein [Nocardioides cavernae]